MDIIETATNQDLSGRDHGGAMWASPPTQGLSQRVRSFKTLVSKEVGISVFQRSYYDHIIRNDEDCQRIWQYINENPAKWAEDEYYVK